MINSTTDPEPTAETQASPSHDASPALSQTSKDGAGDHAAQTILRIKRKRGQDPVEALVIQQAERRAKRRSNAHDAATSRPASAGLNRSRPGDASETENEEPNQPGPSRGVFRLAETVSLDSFSDPAVARLLHERIAALSRSKAADREARPHPIAPLRLARQDSLDSIRKAPASPAPPSGSISDPLHRSLESSDRSRGGSASPLSRSQLGAPGARPATAANEGLQQDKERSVKPRSSVASSLRFKVVRKEPLGQLRHSGSTGSLRRKLRGSALAARPWQDPKKPPEIRSRKAKDAEAVFGRIIDAVSQSSSAGKQKGAKSQARAGEASHKADADIEALDSRFAEMLGDYLKTSDLEPPADLQAYAGGQKRAHEPDTDSEASTDDDSDGEYVYDIYYRDTLPSRTGPAGAAESGLQPAVVPGHERVLATRSSIPDSMTMPRVQGGALVPPEMVPAAAAHFPGLDIAGAEVVMAQLEGFEDTDDELEVADEGEGYESYDEGEDEDSNDEDFYRNDYPEEELPDEEEVDFGTFNDSEGDEEDDPYALSDGSF